MQQFLIPTRRAKLLEKGKLMEQLRERLGCSIELKDGNDVTVDGGAFEEYNARNVIQAFGRGFDIDKAYKLLSDDYFFESIDMKDAFKSQDRIVRIKSRVIGAEGKTKNYIQEVSGAEMAIYGNTISIIGTVDEIKIAKAALNILLEGGTHSKAYFVMEKARRELRKREVM
jgi:ribosomal RNA assembly protein